MEGLKLIAQATFDKHQKFRPSSASSSSSSSGEKSGTAPYRYSVIEIGAFTPSASTLLKRQNSSSLQANNATASGASGSRQNGVRQPAAAAPPPPRMTMNEWMVHEEDLAAFMRKRPVDLVATNASSGERTKKEEVEAVASLKLVCIQRAEPDHDDTMSKSHSHSDPYTLAISRETFLRLYVDIMDADHHALYYMVRQYDGFHELQDSSKNITTKFLGTSHYALLWTFNRKTLETRALFLDRCQTWQTKDATTNTVPSVPATPVQRRLVPQDTSLPSSPSKNWTRNSTNDAAVPAPVLHSSDAWRGFRDTLKVYRGYIFAAQTLGFVAVVHMLRSFDDQVTEEDLPLLKDLENNVSSTILHTAETSKVTPPLPTQTSSSFAVLTEPSVPSNPFLRPSTPPSEGEKHPPPPPLFFSIQQPPNKPPPLLSLDANLANKIHQLTHTVPPILSALARDHETALADTVPPAFLDRYHWVMAAMVEAAVGPLEQHAASMVAYLRCLKGRSERLSGLVRICVCHTSREPATTATTRSDLSSMLSLRCHEADSTPDRGDNYNDDSNNDKRTLLASAALAAATAKASSPNGATTGRDERRRRGDSGFYAGYLLRGHYSHRLR